MYRFSGALLLGALVLSACDTVGPEDSPAATEPLARHTEAAQNLGLNARAVGPVSIEHERVFGELGPIRCPRPPKFRVPPVGVEAEGPLAPEANAEAAQAGSERGGGPTGPLC